MPRLPSLLLAAPLLLVPVLAGVHCTPAPESGREGRARSAIIGGESDKADPAIVLYVMDSPAGSAICTGAVVSPHVIVTAAHCLDPKVTGNDMKPYYVFLGADLNSAADQAVRSNYVRVAETHFHPDFSLAGNADVNDIGVIITATPLPMTPLKMSRTPMDASMVGTKVRMVGYGVNDLDGSADAQESKHAVEVAIAAVEPSNLRYDDPHHAMCEGDSGGPSLMKRADGTEVIVGIHSYDRGGCTGQTFDLRADLYTSYVDDFIKKSDPDFPLDAPQADDAGAEQADAGGSEDPPAAAPAAPAAASSCALVRTSARSDGPALAGVALVLGALASRRRRHAAGDDT